MALVFIVGAFSVKKMLLLIYLFVPAFNNCQDHFKSAVGFYIIIISDFANSEFSGCDLFSIFIG